MNLKYSSGTYTEFYCIHTSFSIMIWSKLFLNYCRSNSQPRVKRRHNVMLSKAIQIEVYSLNCCLSDYPFLLQFGIFHGIDWGLPIKNIQLRLLNAT